MNITLKDQDIRIPKNISFEYMMQLDAESIKNLCQTNQEYRKFCKRTDLWKRVLIRDYQDDFDSMPEYLNEPDWMRVYFWFKKKNHLKEKLNMKNSDRKSGYGTVLFFDSDVETGASRYNSIIGSLLNLGAKVDRKGNISLEGNYMGQYSFVISNDFNKDFISLSADELKQSSKIYSNLIDDVRTFIFMTESKTFEIRKDEYTLLRDKMDEIFFQDIPNYALYNPYSYLYLPDLTIDETIVTDNTYSDYINTKLLSLKPIQIETHKNFQVDEFFDNVPSNEYEIEVKNFENLAFGVYHGTPLLVYSKYNNSNLYLLCPTDNPQPILNVIAEIIE